MKIIASECFTQHDTPREIFPVRNYHNVESITLGVSVSKKEDGNVSLLFCLNGIDKIERNIIQTTVSLINKTTNETIPVSISEQQFVNLDPNYTYELKITKEFKNNQMGCKREIVCIFTPEDQTLPAS